MGRRIIRPRRLQPSERLKGNNRACVGDAGNGLNLFRDEMADIGGWFDIKFYQQIKVPGRRVDLRSDFCIGKLARDLVGLAELTFDLHEKRDHARLRNDSQPYTRGDGLHEPEEACKIAMSG